MIVVRAADRFETVQPGIRTWHCFSAGAHYDPSNLSFGPLIGLDEHVLDPGAGFADHAHRGVEIISYVASGALRHRGDGERVIEAGETFRQDAAEPIRHEESNAADMPLRLIQTTLLVGSGVDLSVERASFRVDLEWAHVFVVDGSWQVDDLSLAAGDSLRVTAPFDATGAGIALVLS